MVRWGGAEAEPLREGPRGGVLRGGHREDLRSVTAQHGVREHRSHRLAREAETVHRGGQASVDAERHVRSALAHVALARTALVHVALARVAQRGEADDAEQPLGQPGRLLGQV